jgi:type I restriction-modification system DNA methylase subunit
VNLPSKSEYPLVILSFLGCELEESKELHDLNKRIQLKRLSQQDPQKIINRLFVKIEKRIHRSKAHTWEKLVELLAKWLVLHEELTLANICCKAFDGLSLEKTKLYLELETLLHIYIEAARRKPWDRIGELYTEENLVRSGQNMTPKSVVDMMIQMTFADRKKERCKYETDGRCKPRKDLCILCANNPLGFPVTQIDPCTGTGRFLWESSILNPDLPMVFFGIEINLSLYRGCLVNMALYSKHPYSIICGNALALDPKKTGPTSSIWCLGNQWKPPSLEEFCWKPSPIRKDAFSLKAFTEIPRDQKT